MHPPVEDCTSCHEFRKAEGATLVKLASPPPDLCLTCHDGLTKAAKGQLKSPHAPVTDTCLNCHDPHSADQTSLLKSPEKELCGSCHAAEDVGKAHPVRVDAVSCLSCHAAHGSDQKGMLAGTVVHAPFGDGSCEACHGSGRATRARRRRGAASVAATCFACHSDAEEKFRKPAVHTAVRNGLCAGCHEPHVGSRKSLLKSDGPGLCRSCHAAIVERAIGAAGHSPARDGCDACHDPHASAVPRQLAEAVPGLCLNCHPATETRPAAKGKPGETIPSALAGKHLDTDLTKLECMTCHDPHGGSGGVKAQLLAGSAHEPFASGSCDSCHEGGKADQLAEGGAAAMCLACHSDIGDAARAAKVPHAAMDGDCTACHVPHASRQPRLVKLPAGGACVECHADQAPGKGEIAHGAVMRWGCQACHEPHGGANPKLLRANEAELCLSCHDAKKLEPEEGKSEVVLMGRIRVPASEASGIRGLVLSADGRHDHPVKGHRVLGVTTPDEIKASRTKATFRDEFRCSTCHDPHKGRAQGLFSGGKENETEVCLACHVK